MLKLQAECMALRLSICDLCEDKKVAYDQIEKNYRHWLQKLLENIETDDPELAASVDRRALTEILTDEP